MQRPISSITRLILERSVLESRQYHPANQPAVLSCGGMYLPRAKTTTNNKIVFHVLNLANEKEPIKIYVGRRGLANQLYQILAKEAMN